MVIFDCVPRQTLSEANERLQHVVLEMLKSAMATEELITRKVGASRMPGTSAVGVDSGLDHTSMRAHGAAGDAPGTGKVMHLIHLIHQ